jgi:uncharacterized protein with NAD-binding domain and iron-sulfur cluster
MPQARAAWSDEEQRIRVAIVGGGCAAMTTAFELSHPKHAGRYDVTVYQMGWRLGGKGASGRGPGARIEEHGLHLWMGFYENAFRLMRDCYEELGRDPFRCPVATWQDAFTPAPHVAVVDKRPDGGWEPWVAHFPPGQGLPGDPLPESSPFTLTGYLSKAVALVVELVRSADASRAQAAAAGQARAEPPPAAAPAGAPSVDKLVDFVLRHGQLGTVAAILEATEMLARVLEALGPLGLAAGVNPLLRLVEAIALAAKHQLQILVAGDTSLERVWHVVDLVMAIIRGSVAHGLTVNPQGFDAIDAYDWREWLAMHGASPASLDSGFVRGIYDLAFAFEHGDPRRPRLSAAAALRGATRMFFTYRGSLFWRMSAGMGDIVFAPLYEVLKKRGVRFEFFHELERVELSPDASHVSALSFRRQAEVKAGTYEPLVEIQRLPCWPAEPDYAQLVDGEALRREGRQFESPWETRHAGTRVLRVEDDFDFVVLAVGGAVVPHVCSELIAAAPRWQQMSRGLNSVATQALQLWLSEDMATLGWQHPPTNLSGWTEPFDTWADMSHLIVAEDFASEVKSIAYFCSPLPEPQAGGAEGEAFHAAQHAAVREHAVRFLDEEIGALWPNAKAPGGGFRWELLASACADSSSGAARLGTQFWTANVRPSDRYIQTLPGTQAFRLSPLDMSFDNLTVAGDWTASGLNTGCVESAVMSGLLAAHAISESPPLERIVGYHHP